MKSIYTPMRTDKSRKISLAAALTILLAASSNAEETINLKTGGSLSGKIQRTLTTVEVTIPHGKITLPAAETTDKSPKPATPPESPKAWTEGRFGARYRLSAKAGDVRAENVHVTVQNKTRYRVPKSETLRHHEEVHQKINEQGARQMEEMLRLFRTANKNLKGAEKEFQQLFHQEVRRIEELHRAWDETHVPR